MGNCAFGYQNQIKTAGLVSYSSAVPGLDPSQWQTNDSGSASMAWQTTATNGWVVFDTGSTTTQWGAVAISRTNLTALATWHIQVWQDAGQTVQVLNYGSGATGSPCGVSGGQAVYVFPAPVSGQRLKITVYDSTNPDGFLNMATAFAGPLFRPLGHPSWSTTRGRDDRVDEIVTRGGTEFPQFRWSRRRWSLDLQSLRQTELPTWYDLDNTARLGGNVLYIPDSASATIAADATFGRLMPKADIGYPFGFGDRLSWKADATERL